MYVRKNTGAGKTWWCWLFSSTHKLLELIPLPER